MENIYKSRYLYLLIALFFYFVSNSFLAASQYSIVLSLLFTAIIGLCLLSLSSNKFFVLMTCLFGCMTLIFHWLISINYSAHNINLYLGFYVFDIIFLLFIIYSVITSIINDKQITFDALFGAICSYLLIGFAWGLIYLLINTANASAFSQSLVASTVHESLKHAFYYSFTTLTTLGYGDILPRTDIARTASWVEAVLGQIYLVVWISELVGKRIIQKAQH